MTSQYIVFDNNSTVWGYGDSADDAWEMARHELLMTWGGTRDAITDEDMTGYTIRAASDALVQAVIERGGDVAWHTDARGLAVTQAEYDAP